MATQDMDYTIEIKFSKSIMHYDELALACYYIIMNGILLSISIALLRFPRGPKIVAQGYCKLLHVTGWIWLGAFLLTKINF